VREPLALNDESPDYASFTLANRMLGQGGSSRLWKRIREGEGLSYNVISYVGWSAHEPNSMWTTQAIFAPQNRGRVETAFREELSRALQTGFSAQELEEARKGLLASRRLGRSQDSNLAAALLNNLQLDRTMLVSKRVDDQIATLSVDEVNAALRRYLDPAKLVFGFGGDFKDARPAGN